jgi:acetyl esterase/lipase
MLLLCGAYDLTLPDYQGPMGDFLHTVLWAYSGRRDFLQASEFKTASVAQYVTREFPPSYITAGNADPLEPQSKAMAERLQQAGVEVDELFYLANYRPALPHEYQFNLDQPEGRNSLQRMLAFLQRHMQETEPPR